MMSWSPETVEGLKVFRYRVWGGQPKGEAWQPSRCAEEVADGGRSPLSRQCTRKPGFGKGGLFCKQHSKYHPEEARHD